jgi:hypothetical protein
MNYLHRTAATAALALFTSVSAFAAPILLPTDQGAKIFDTSNFATGLADSSCSSTCLVFGSGVPVASGPFTTAQIAPLIIGADISKGVALGQGPTGGVADFIIPSFGALATIANGAGADFVIWEAGSPAEPVLISVSLGGGAFSAAISYLTLAAAPSDSSSGFQTNSIHINLDDFGIAAGALIDQVRIQGLFTGVGGSGPDILAIAALNAGPATVPEPGTLALFGLAGLLAWGASARRRNGARSRSA